MTMALYVGGALILIGTLGTVFGPGTRDPIVRFINVEVSSFGLLLIFLVYHTTLALITYIAATGIVALIFMRMFLRMERLKIAEGS